MKIKQEPLKQQAAEYYKRILREEGIVAENTPNNSNVKSAILFPGQGAQFPGMGREFCEKYEVSRQTYEEASDILHIDMKKMCFGDADGLDQTKNTQPALLTTQIAIFRAMNQLGIKADYLAGLSCGEYSAIVAAGGMRFGDAVRLVQKRGIFMQEAAPAGMTMMAAVIGLPNGTVEEICGEAQGRVAITNYNCPGQAVIGGYKEDVEYISQKLDEAGAISVKPLNISVASHCMIQKKASEQLGQEMEDMEFLDIKIPYISNVSAQPVTDRRLIKELLVEQLYSPVRWQHSLKYLTGQGVGCFYEIAADTSLKLMERIAKKVPVISVWIPGDLP